MAAAAPTLQRSDPVAEFVFRLRRPPRRLGPTVVSLFSGAGLSDAGYLAAGFQVVVQAELESNRAAIGKSNFPESEWIVGDVRRTASQVISTYRKKSSEPLGLLVATPPCQGMSSSNPSRGKRSTDEARKHAKKNALLLRIIKVANELTPRAIVAENVRQILTHAVYWNGTKRTVVDVLKRELPAYEFWDMPVDMADYGVPQSRSRAVIVGIRKVEACVATLVDHNRAPIPAPTHSEGGPDGYAPWVTIRQWCEARKYEPLDAQSQEAASSGDPLHYVPFYEAERYRLIADIPPHSGRSAYENDTCPACRRKVLPKDRAHCSQCGGVLWNRPIVRKNGRARLIKGFHSSYRRMRSDRPAATITTNSSHVGSDFKIHPYENRVLSARECADLQTVPRWFNWTAAIEGQQNYLVRNLVGEALPPYFTYLHGRILAGLLRRKNVARSKLLSACPS